MDLYKLTLDELRRFPLEAEQKEKDVFWKEVRKIITGVTEGNIEQKRLNQNILFFLIELKHNEEFFEKDYVECVALKVPVLKQRAQAIFKNYKDYKEGKKSFISPVGLDNRESCFDEVLEALFCDGYTTVLNKEFKFVKISTSHLKALLDTGEAYLTQVSRNTKFYSLNFTNFFGNKKSPKNWMIPDGDTVGIEIEMLFPNVESKLRFSSWLHLHFPGWSCEYDGSLQDHGNAGDNGLELISPPLLLQDMISKIEPICSKAVELGGKGFPAGVFYGMHVTNRVPKMIRGGATREEIASRYIWLLNHPSLRLFWQLFSRRKGESFLTYCPFQNVLLETCLVSESGLGAGDRAHRRSVFVRSRSLLETRIFRSNLNTRQVIANIEICHITMQYCRSNAFSKDNPNNFSKFLEEAMSDSLQKILYRQKNTPIVELFKACVEYNIKQQPNEDYSL